MGRRFSWGNGPGTFLDELAAFAVGLHPPEGEDVVAAVSAALGRMALDLTAHVEAV